MFVFITIPMLSNEDYTALIEEKTRMLIIKNQIKQSALAKAIDCTTVTVSNFMNGHSCLCFPNIIKAVRYINGNTYGYFDITEQEEADYLKQKADKETKKDDN